MLVFRPPVTWNSIRKSLCPFNCPAGSRTAPSGFSSLSKSAAATLASDAEIRDTPWPLRDKAPSKPSCAWLVGRLRRSTENRIPKNALNRRMLSKGRWTGHPGIRCPAQPGIRSIIPRAAIHKRTEGMRTHRRGAPLTPVFGVSGNSPRRRKPFEGPRATFAYFGGVPARILYDNAELASRRGMPEVARANDAAGTGRRSAGISSAIISGSASRIGRGGLPPLMRGKPFGRPLLGPHGLVLIGHDKHI